MHASTGTHMNIHKRYYNQTCTHNCKAVIDRTFRAEETLGLALRHRVLQRLALASKEEGKKSKKIN